MTKPKTSNKSVRLPDETWARIAAAAEERQMKVNAAMAEAALWWLENPTARVRIRDEPSKLIPLKPMGPASQIAEDLAQRRAAEDKRMAGWFAPKGRKT